MCFEERDATDEFDTDDEFAVAVAVAAYEPMCTELASRQSSGHCARLNGFADFTGSAVGRC
jgi:hypothetical protein